MLTYQNFTTILTEIFGIYLALCYLFWFFEKVLSKPFLLVYYAIANVSALF